MKLLFDCTDLSYYHENSGHKAGIFYVALNLFRAFKKLGIDITLCCDFRRLYFIEEIEELRDFKLVKEESLLNKFIAYILFKTRNCPRKIKFGLIVLARFYDNYFNRLNKKKQKLFEEYDAYFSPFSPAPIEIQSSQIKNFRMIHDVIPIIENGLSKNPKDWHNKVYNTINSKDFYLTNSEFTRQDVLKYFPVIKEENIKTTLLAANNSFYKTNEKPNGLENKKYIFSLCTLGKRKNILFGIKNFFEFINKNNINDLYMVLGGSIWEKYRKEFETTLNQYDRSKIIITGYIEEEELRKYYSNALCFIYPSLYEGFGLPVLEAMQCECPVIASNRTSIPEVLGNTGITVNPEDDNEMINAYNKMYYDQAFRNECSKKGLKRASEFSWEKCAQEILNFINEKTI